MSNKNPSADALKSWTQVTQDWTNAVHVLVKDEVQKAVETVGKELESKLAQAAPAPAAAPASAAPAPAAGAVDMKKLVDQVLNSQGLKEKINQSLEQGLRGVLPQILQRLKQEIEERVKDTPAGMGDAKTPVKAVVNSAEMKEMLEDRFRMMLVYITQDVLPRELQKHGIGA